MKVMFEVSHQYYRYMIICHKPKYVLCMTKMPANRFSHSIWFFYFFLVAINEWTDRNKRESFFGDWHKFFTHLMLYRHPVLHELLALFIWKYSCIILSLKRDICFKILLGTVSIIPNNWAKKVLYYNKFIL